MRSIPVFILCFAIAIPAFASDATIVRKSRLFETPSFTGEIVTELPIGTEVTSTERKGGWARIQVKEGTDRGWIRAYTMRSGVSGEQVKQATVTTNSSSGGLAGIGRSLANLFGTSNRNENEGNLTTTVGVRGLSAEQIESAKPDSKAAEKMISYQVTPKQSKSFAKKAGLKSNKLKQIKIKEKTSDAGDSNDK
ncbi:MAG: SH3 domain-containing protein [Pseudomonadota bacterium]